MHPPRGQGIELTLGAPRQETAQIRVRVITGGAREAGHVGSHRQPKWVCGSPWVSESDRANIGKALHGPTLRPSDSTAYPTERRAA